MVDLYKAPGKIWPDAWFGDGQNPSTVAYTSDHLATDFVEASSTKWITNHPVLHNADTLGIRPDLIGRPIDSWAELINPEFAGKSALVAFPADRSHGRCPRRSRPMASLSTATRAT